MTNKDGRRPTTVVGSLVPLFVIRHSSFVIPPYASTTKGRTIGRRRVCSQMTALAGVLDLAVEVTPVRAVVARAVRAERLAHARLRRVEEVIGAASSG